MNQMNTEHMNQDADGLALSDLIALYRALAGARSSVDDVIASICRDEMNPRQEIEKALIREERAEIDARINELCCEIEAAPTRSADDAATKQRVRRAEMGDPSAAAAFGVGHDPVIAETVDARLTEMQEQLEWIALAINVHVEVSGRDSRLLQLTDALGAQMAELRDMVAPIPLTMDNAAAA